MRTRSQKAVELSKRKTGGQEDWRNGGMEEWRAEGQKNRRI